MGALTFKGPSTGEGGCWVTGATGFSAVTAALLLGSLSTLLGLGDPRYARWQGPGLRYRLPETLLSNSIDKWPFLCPNPIPSPTHEILATDINRKQSHLSKASRTHDSCCAFPTHTTCSGDVLLLTAPQLGRSLLECDRCRQSVLL